MITSSSEEFNVSINKITNHVSSFEVLHLKPATLDGIVSWLSCHDQSPLISALPLAQYKYDPRAAYTHCMISLTKHNLATTKCFYFCHNRVSMF